MEVFSKQFWPTESGLVDFSGSYEEVLTGVHGGLHMMVNGLIFRGMWQSSRQGIWWTLAEALQGNTLNKIVLRKGGDLV